MLAKADKYTCTWLAQQVQHELDNDWRWEMKADLANLEMPHALDSERAVLASILIDNGLMAGATDLIEPDLFYRDSHRQVWMAMQALHQDGIAIDIVTIAQNFPIQMKKAGGPAGIASLLDTGVPVSNLDHHIRILTECYAKRLLVREALALLGAAQQAEPLSTYDECLRRSLAAIEGLSVIPARSAQEVANNSINQMELVRSGQKKARAIKTSIPEFDRLTRGLQPGDLMFIGAAPGVGKTALATTMAMNAAFAGRQTLIVSLEMQPEQVVNRLLARMSSIDSMRLLEPECLTEDEIASLRLAESDFGSIPLKVADRTQRTLGQIKSLVKREIERHGLELVIIDYLQIIQCVGRFESRRLQLEHIGRQLAEFAQETGVALIVPAAINRKDGGAEPSMQSLREAGVEYEAHKILVAWKDDVVDQTVRFKLDKNRGGLTGRFDLVFHGASCTFTSPEAVVIYDA